MSTTQLQNEGQPAECPDEVLFLLSAQEIGSIGGPPYKGVSPQEHRACCLSRASQPDTFEPPGLGDVLFLSYYVFSFIWINCGKAPHGDLLEVGELEFVPA